MNRIFGGIYGSPREQELELEADQAGERLDELRDIECRLQQKFTLLKEAGETLQLAQQHVMGNRRTQPVAWQGLVGSYLRSLLHKARANLCAHWDLSVRSDYGSLRRADDLPQLDRLLITAPHQNIDAFLSALRILLARTQSTAVAIATAREQHTLPALAASEQSYQKAQFALLQERRGLIENLARLVVREGHGGGKDGRPYSGGRWPVLTRPASRGIFFRAQETVW